MSINKSLFFVALPAIFFSQDSTQIELSQKIGPIIDFLPVLDSLIINQKDTTDFLLKAEIDPQKTMRSYPINASGTFFRGIEMNTQGAGGLNGGLRFQVAGKLSENIQVSGTVTDESIPIQPEGTTAALDELDKVYLNVAYPAGELTAGDLTIINKSGKYNNNNRNIVGIKNNINSNNTNFRAVIGQSKGKYHRLEMKGKDGHQGPYFLTSKEGMRNVIISAGSESVWLNGQKLSRGEDRDYTINYASGEITFTPKYLIFFDSDIDIEYQYSGTNYKSNYLETGLDGNVGDRFQYNIVYIDDRDNKAGSFLTNQQKSTFQSKDVLYESGVIPDSLGDYEKINGVFIFRNYKNPSVERFTITFNLDPEGFYIRKISEQNRIYYEYVDDISNSVSERYSPGSTIKAAASHQFFQVNSTIKIKEDATLITEGAFSIRDQNLFSSQKSSELNGNAFRFALSHKPVTLGKIEAGYQVEHWQNSNQFQSMSRDRHVNFNEVWDLQGASIGSEALSSISSQIVVGDGLISQLDFSQYSSGLQEKNRFNLDFSYRGHNLKKMDVVLNQVRSDSVFQEADINIKLLDGRIQPYMKYSYEYRENSYRFDDSVFGIVYKEKTREFSIGLGNREDQQMMAINSQGMKRVMSGKFTQIDFKNQNLSGWRQEWMFRQRIQKNEDGQIQNDFNAIRAAVNYRQNESPFQFDFVLNSQTSMSETRAVVYDSIGVGLGHYRYDVLVNEYVSDDNGAYIAHTVLTGDHRYGSQLDGLTRFSADFSKWKFDRFKHWKYHLLNRTDYHGPKFSLGESVIGKKVQWARYNNRHELIYKKKGFKNRHRFWWQNRINYNGLDPRGWERKDQTEYALESLLPLKNNLQLMIEGDLHRSKVSSEFNRITNRTLNGFNSGLGIKGQNTKNLQWDSRFIYYRDRTEINQDTQEFVDAYGLKINWIHFIGKDGRLEGNMEYYIANGFPEMPPEALNGIADKRTLRANIMVSIFLGRTLSVNATLLYLDDIRYNNFIKLRGELRAHF